MFCKKVDIHLDLHFCVQSVSQLALTEFYYHLLLASAWCPSRARGACVVVKKIENIILDWIRNPDNHH